MRFFGATEKEIGMGVGVVSQDVSAGGDFFHEAGTFPDKFSHEEEGGLGAVASEEIEKLRSDGRIGAVIKGDRELACGSRLANGGTEKLRASIDGGVGGKSHSTEDDNWRGNEKRVHRQHFRTRSRLVESSRALMIYAYRNCSRVWSIAGNIEGKSNEM